MSGCDHHGNSCSEGAGVVCEMVCLVVVSMVTWWVKAIAGMGMLEVMWLWSPW